MRDLVLGRATAWSRIVHLPSSLRFRHLNVLGKSGAGKSTLLHRLIHTDCKAPYATIVFDSGDLVRDVYEALPDATLPRVSFFSVARPIPYNPFARRAEDPARLENELFGLIDAVSAGVSSTPPLSARMKRLLSAAIGAVLREPSPDFSTLAALLLARKHDLRRALQLREDEFAATWEGALDRLSQFLRDPRIRRIVANGHALDFGDMIDGGKILLVSLAGLEPALKRFVGTLLFHGLQSTIFERPKERRRPVAIYIDEFADFLGTPAAAQTFQVIFSQGRKFKASITAAATDYGSIPSQLLDTIHGTAASLLTFACGPREARTMSEVFAEQWPPERIALLPDYHAIARVGDDIHLLRTLPGLSPARSLPEDHAPSLAAPPDPFKLSLELDDHREPYNRARRPRASHTSTAA